MFRVLHRRSGRVIALGRTLLAAIFLFAIWMDPSQPLHAGGETYAMLGAYVLVSASIALATWNNWWLDAKLAAPSHILDVVVFTLLVLTTNGYTSPFFVFFVFLILSAAIRWGWRETTTTAAAVILLYIAAGLVAEPTAGGEFELQRFIVRSGHLLILSAILIWFGVNQGFSGNRLPSGNLLPEPSPDHPPMQGAAEGAMRLTGARTGLLLWKPASSSASSATIIDPKGVASRPVPHAMATSIGGGPFLFDLRRDRAIDRSRERRIRFFAPTSVIGPELRQDFHLEEGLAIPIRTEAGTGQLFLGEIDGLATDYIELGAFIAESIEKQIERHALLQAVKESATARARLSLARDLHDGIVQFLAGATFRVEAIARALRSGERPEPELEQLKQLMLLEQQELRSAIGVLRKDRIAVIELAEDLGHLCERLARQWDISCTFDAKASELDVPMRLHLDSHQLVREAVANAVRHGKARSIDVRMMADGNELRLEIANDGREHDRLSEGQPWSLRERVDEANGTLTLVTGDAGTSVLIILPISLGERP